MGPKWETIKINKGSYKKQIDQKIIANCSLKIKKNKLYKIIS